MKHNYSLDCPQRISGYVPSSAKKESRKQERKKVEQTDGVMIVPLTFTYLDVFDRFLGCV